MEVTPHSDLCPATPDKNSGWYTLSSFPITVTYAADTD